MKNGAPSGTPTLEGQTGGQVVAVMPDESGSDDTSVATPGRMRGTLKALLVAAALVTPTAMLNACGDDSAKGFGVCIDGYGRLCDAGTDGAGGGAGSDGTGGDAGSDGTGGEAGSDGTGGDAGSDGTGGDAGSDGAGGDAGSDGTGGDAGSDGTGGDAGSDGTGGDAGSDGTGGDGGSDAPTCSDPTPHLCGTTCVNKNIDDKNCGDCGNICTGTLHCSSGTCLPACAPPKIECSSGCVDKSTDNKNCGGCGITCSSTKTCSGGFCK